MSGGKGEEKKGRKGRLRERVEKNGREVGGGGR